MVNDISIRLINRYWPQLIWNRAKPNRIEQKKHMFILDCDTDLDIDVLISVHEKFKNIGIRPIYAVPGEMLLKGFGVYRKVMEDGFEFINHGYRQHTFVDRERKHYLSTFFYSHLSKEEIYNDIKMADDILLNTFGYKSYAYRTPHFGTFDKKENLEFIHSILSELKYKYSSSSGPLNFFKMGNRYVSRNILEFPVSGTATWPLVIPDSYTFRFAKNSFFSREKYEEEVRLLFEKMEKNKVSRLNFYADPSQIYDWENFFKSQSLFAKYNVGTFKEYGED